MTLGIRQLAMFASKNKQVVQIRIQVSQVEAVLERWSLGRDREYMEYMMPRTRYIYKTLSIIDIDFLYG